MCSEAVSQSSRWAAHVAALAMLWLVPLAVWAEPEAAPVDGAATTRERNADAPVPSPGTANASETPEQPADSKPAALSEEGELQTPRESAPVAAAAPEPPHLRQARELTARARERFDAGDFSAALVEFTRAYELLERDARRAELLNNIAVCHERMFRYDLALHYYERYLREGAPDAADRAEVQAVTRGLRGLLGTLRITANVSSEIWIDHRPYGVLSRELLVPAGSHVIELRARAHESARREVRVVPRASQALHFELQPLPEYHGVHRAYFWAGVGLTGAALVTGSALGLRALAVEKDAEALNREDLATIEHEQKYQNLALASDIAWGATALFAVGSAVLFFLTDWHGAGRERRPAQRSVRVSVDPRVTPDTLAVALRGGWR